MTDMSILAIIRWAGRQRIANKPAKNVLNAVATYADRTGTAHPSQRELAGQTGYSERAVRMALAMLEEDGYLKRVERRRGNGSRTSDSLILKLEKEAHNRHGMPVAETAVDGTACQAPRNPVPSSPARDSGPTTFEQPGEQPREQPKEKNPPVSQERHRPRGATSPRAIPCPNDFEPDPGHVAQAATRGFARSFVGEVRDRMRDWSKANAHRPIARKSDWGLTFTNFLRKAMDEEEARVTKCKPRVANGAIGLAMQRWGDRSATPRRSTNGMLDLAAEMVGVPGDPADILTGFGLESDRSRNEAALQMALRGEWPVGGGVFVAADSPEGDAWEEHYRRLGKGAKWRPLSKGYGGMMPCAMPPGSVRAHPKPRPPSKNGNLALLADALGIPEDRAGVDQVARRMFGGPPDRGPVIDHG